MNDNSRGWLPNSEMEEALASLRNDATERLELPSSVRRSVQSRIEASIGALALGGSALGGQAVGEPDVYSAGRQTALESGPGAGASLGPASLNGAAVKASWLALGGKALLLGGLLAGGIALVARGSLVGGGPVPRTTNEASASATNEENAAQPSRDLSRGEALSPVTDWVRSESALTATEAREEPSEPAASQLKARRTTRTTELGAAAPGSTKTERPGDLNYELTLLRLARAALVDRPTFARELLRSYDQRFPEGTLRKEYELLIRRAEAQTDAPLDATPSPNVNHSPSRK